MTKTFKILSTISFIAMAIVLTFVGVWALADLDFTVGGDITYTAPKPSITLYWDSANSYWYVKMGSTDTISEIKWRLVGLDGERYTSSTKPTSGKGTFILETNTTITHAFDSTDNDYATSDIREYLKGQYLTDLNLTNDATYKAIAPRSTSELYQDMAWNVDDNSYQIEDCTPPIDIYDTTDDSLWLMSIAEVYTLVGGGTIINNTINNDWSSYFDNLIWNSVFYWLRTPDLSYDDFKFCVSPNGDWNYGYVYNDTYAVRPAFNLEF